VHSVGDCRSGAKIFENEKVIDMRTICDCETQESYCFLCGNMYCEECSESDSYCNDCFRRKFGGLK